MEQTVYADLLFLINFSMDFLCLFLVAKLLARRLSLLRGGIAASLGGMYSVAALFLPFPSWGALAADVAVCLLMCFIAFGNRRERPTALLLVSAAFFLSSMLLGGIMTAIFNLLNRAAPPLEELSNGQDIPLWIFAPVAALSTLLTRIGERFFRARAQTESADLEICLGKRKTVVRAMCDNGNLLRDTLSGKPVIVADKRVALNLLPADCPPLSEWDAETVAVLPPAIAARVRLIPVGTANAEGLMIALRPDGIIVRTSHGERNADALLGFGDVQCALKDCSALISPELVT